VSKIARVRTPGGDELLGVVRDDDTLEVLEGDLFGDWWTAGRTLRLSACRLLPPLVPPNILAIGLNYRAHARESGHELPDHPALFIKATTALVGPEASIVLPRMAPDEVDYECELAVVIGRTAKHVDEEDALQYVLGYTCANDVSARDVQQRLDIQWARAKSFDTFAPLGPWIETELDPSNAGIRTRLNGRLMQESNTSDLIFSVPALVSWLSQSMTLLPGTVILTGTPSGVGFARTPPVFLRPGDVVEVEIDGIGTLRNPVVVEER